MRAELINPILTATSKVFRDKLGWELIRGRPFLKRDASQTRNVVASVGIAGRVRGTLMLTCDPDIALAAATASSHRRQRDVAQGALDIWTDLVSAIAAAVDGEARVSLATVATGTAQQVETHSSYTPLCVPFTCSAGEIILEVALIERPADSKEDKDDRSSALEKAQQTLDLVRDLAAGVAAGVDEHNTRVRQINTDLESADGDGQEAVVKAIADLVAANEQMESQLSAAQQQLVDQAQQIEEYATDARTDALTQVANRRELDARLAKELAEAVATGRPVSLAMMDIDHFKLFNDQHGHQAGDEVLRTVAQRLSKRVGDCGLVARYGGEEFAILFPGATLEEAAVAAENARKAIYLAKVTFEGKSLRVTASSGTAQWQTEESLDAWVQRADAALYAAKEAGRNCQCWHDGKSCAAIRLDGQELIVADDAAASV